MEQITKNPKIVWVHNFDTSKNPSSGVFMFDLYNQCKQSGMEISLYYISPSFNPVKLLKQIVRLRCDLKSFDIIHAQYGSATGFVSTFARGYKILSLRGSDLFKTPAITLAEKIHISIGNLLTKLAIRRSDKIVVMSDNMKARVKQISSKKQVDVIPDGINLDVFKPSTIKSCNNIFRVLFSSVAEYNPVKRYQLAKAAFDIFNKRVPDSELVIMTGVAHNKVCEFVNSVDVILLTSTHEGWPNIIKEGLACNVPFVSTNVSDLKQIADTSNCCFVCNDNPEELANALYQLWENRFQQNDLRHYIQEFDMNSIVTKIKNLYY